MRPIDADRLLSERMKSMYYHLPNGDIAIPIIDIKNAPTIEPERKKGKWIYKKDLKQFFCDQCGEPSLTDDDRYIYSMDFSNFCPNYGADMRGYSDE